MKFIQAINALGPIPTALFLIFTGGFFMLIFKWAGLAPEDVKTGHDIVIAGISFISGIAVASRTVGPNSVTTVGAPQIPPQPVGPAQPNKE